MAIFDALNDLNNAIDAPDNIINLEKFDGGLVDAMDAGLIKATEAATANDCVFDNHIINLIKGDRYFGEAMPDGSILSIFYFKKY